MEDQDDVFFNEENNFLSLSSLVFSESEESESDYDERDYFDGIDFVVPTSLLNQYPSEDPILALEIALIERSLLAKQEKSHLGASNILSATPSAGYENGQPVSQMLEFGRLLIPYYTRYIQMLYDLASDNSEQENSHSDSDTSSVSLNDWTG
ncbi:hypothetical protein DSO57_1012083 [Entomophthora muscae]|uniref:Uncharacterized protein n=1 Tax=Entomophthora muscae TaxID=34485 RepID=A0ACC2TT77_9FUNG|nr:hypothetical protein DSO57_1012083 [Entomophthora muscae]